MLISLCTNLREIGYLTKVSLLETNNQLMRPNSRIGIAQSAQLQVCAVSQTQSFSVIRLGLANHASTAQISVQNITKQIYYKMTFTRDNKILFHSPSGFQIGGH